MDLILTILKVGGILVSGALGILGTTTETRDKETNRLTSWGKWALCLTVAGFAVALGAQIFETLKQKNEEIESRKRTETMLKRLGETVDGIDRIVTPITGSISVNAVYELPANDSIPIANTTIRKLQDYFDQYLNSNPRTGNDTAVGILDVDYWIYHTQPKPGTPPRNLVIFRLDRFLREFPADPTLQGIRKLLESLRKPTLGVQLATAPREGNLVPLLNRIVNLSSLEREPASAAVYYALPSRRILVHWQYNFPKEAWGNNGKFVSLHDLANAYCYLELDWRDGYPDPLRPIVADLQFGDYFSASLDTFTPTTDQYIVQATMPSQTEIMSANASRFMMPYPITSKLYSP
jgi:hypothetical protein